MTKTQNLNSKFSTTIYFIVIVLILNFKLQAQNNDFILSSSEDKTEHVFSTFGADNNLFYTYYDEDESTILFESFSINDLKSKIKTKIILPKIDDKKQKFESILRVNQTSYLFTSTFDKKSKIYTIYACKVNDEGKLNTAGIKIDEISSKENGDRNYINISLSKDSNNIMIVKTYDKNISDKIKGQISYKVLDDNLKIVYTNQIELEKPLIEYKISNLLLDKNNNLYFLTCERKYNNEIKDSRRNYTVNLYNSKDSKLYKSEVNIDEIHMLDANILVNENEQLICTGTYAIEKTFNDQWITKKCVKGMFYEIFDKNNLTFISKNKINIAEKFPDYMFYDNYLTHSFELKNNKLIIICENQSTTISNGYYLFSFGPLLVSSFDLKNANNTWSKIIENDTKKNTTKCKDGTMSYVLFKKENSFKILYNCNRQIDLDEKGNIDEKNIFTASQQFIESFSSSSTSCYFQNNYNAIILSTYSKSNGYKYAKLTIK